MNRSFVERLGGELEGFRRDGVYKRFNHIDSPQSARVKMEGRGEVIILSSNNYLGLCDEPEVVEAGRRGLDRFGAGTGSVRFICGTFTIHRELEQRLARFVGAEASLTYVSCWNANEGLMPACLDEKDAVISDALNHASIIDSIRLCKAQRKVYPHSDMSALEKALREASSARHRFICTDGVFSMEGDITRLPDIDQARLQEGGHLGPGLAHLPADHAVHRDSLEDQGPGDVQRHLLLRQAEKVNAAAVAHKPHRLADRIGVARHLAHEIDPEPAGCRAHGRR